MNTHLPESSPFQNAAMLAANLGHSMSVDLLVRSVHAYEADLAQKGHGTPPLENVVELSVMWGSIVEQAAEGEH